MSESMPVLIYPPLELLDARGVRSEASCGVLRFLRLADGAVERQLIAKSGGQRGVVGRSGYALLSRRQISCRA